jgi:hypothetical protein
MIDPKKSILQLDKPKIVLDELSLSDPIESKDKKVVEKSGAKDETTVGALAPLIVINSYQVKDIRYLRIDLSNKIPELVLRFETKETAFLYSAYPKDGDLLCLFIRAHSEMYKPIRHDYLITEVTGPFPDYDPEVPGDGGRASSNYHTFTIKAQLRIPKLYQHFSKSYPEKTSFQVLREIAKDLNLGFSTNEKETKDSMNWLCPNSSYNEFIDNVAKCSWKSEEDFYDWWIDPYYNLTFVNLNTQLLKPSKEQDKILPAYGPSQGLYGGLSGNDKPLEFETPLILTNDPNFRKYPTHIKAYSVRHAAGYINNKYGYVRNLQFYDTTLKSDKPKNKYVNYDIESITQKNLKPNEILFKGRTNEKIYKDEKKKSWMGTQYFENFHKNFQQAYVQNVINNVENYKVYLHVELASFVPWIYRGQSIPVSIVHANNTDVAANSKDSIKDGPQDPQKYKAGMSQINMFLSGEYVILGSYIEFSNDGDGFKTIFELGKREWQVNPGVGSTPEPITE